LLHVDVVDAQRLCRCDLRAQSDHEGWRCGTSRLDLVESGIGGGLWKTLQRARFSERSGAGLFSKSRASSTVSAATVGFRRGAPQSGFVCDIVRINPWQPASQLTAVAADRNVSLFVWGGGCKKMTASEGE
jgi:hypothetical protein